jgi:hypothetical protein
MSRNGLRECRALPAHEMTRHPLDHSREERLLVMEVVVDEPLAHPRFLGDLVHRERRRARGHDPANRRAKDALRGICTRTRDRRCALGHFSFREAGDAR